MGIQHQLPWEEAHRGAIIQGHRVTAAAGRGSWPFSILPYSSSWCLLGGAAVFLRDLGKSQLLRAEWASWSLQAG